MYTLTATENIIRDADGAFIPGDPPGNVDYRAYLAWLADGNTPAPYVAPAPIVALTFLQFMALFTPEEQAAVIGSSDVQVKIFTIMGAGAGTLHLDNVEVVAGVNYLATAGLITAPRAAAILANEPHS